jgi:hypothetical protein
MVMPDGYATPPAWTMQNGHEQGMLFKGVLSKKWTMSPRTSHRQISASMCRLLAGKLVAATGLLQMGTQAVHAFPASVLFNGALQNMWHLLLPVGRQLVQIPCGSHQVYGVQVGACHQPPRPRTLQICSAQA